MMVDVIRALNLGPTSETAKTVEHAIAIAGLFVLLQDLLETMGGYVDSLKLAGGSFVLMPPKVLAELVRICHDHKRDDLYRRLR